MRKTIPKSIKKHIRAEKSRIRKEVLSRKEQEKSIKALCEKIFFSKSQESNS